MILGLYSYIIQGYWFPKKISKARIILTNVGYIYLSMPLIPAGDTKFSKYEFVDQFGGEGLGVGLR